jgi:hypothetical protein
MQHKVGATSRNPAYAQQERVIRRNTPLAKRIVEVAVCLPALLQPRRSVRAWLEVGECAFRRVGEVVVKARSFWLCEGSPSWCSGQPSACVK